MTPEPYDTDLTREEFEDMIVKKYQSFKEDFKLMFSECADKSIYYSFDDWWRDFMTYKFSEYKTK